MIIEWPKWDKIINNSFVPYIKNTDRYLILIGGRGSSKSDFASKKLIYRCLSEPYFRYILIRNTYESIKDSSFQTLVDNIHILGLGSLFQIKYSPLEITCVNGNKFIARGCDNTTKLKSIKDPTGAWYEEDIPNESDFITITTSIRTTKANYLQEIFTVNPEVDGDYEQNFFWKRFFKDKPSGNFSDVTNISINEKESIDIKYTIHHSTYLDNRWIGKEFIAYLESLKFSNPYYYSIYCLGHWGKKLAGNNPFVFNFDTKKHIDNKIKYDPSKQLIISIDFNKNPITALFAHTYKDGYFETLEIFDEVSIMAGSIEKLSNYIRNNFKASLNTMLVTGDAMGNIGQIALTDNASLYDQLRRYLNLRQSQVHVTANPQHVVSREQVNYMLYNYPVLSINENRCKSLVFDIQNVQCDIYGGIIKRNRNDTAQRSDMLDNFRYLINTFFSKWIKTHSKM